MTDHDFTAGLNSEQKKAVLHEEGPLLILAGAGSGKTRVITHRISHLIQNRNINPESILAVTFTNKAAKEMQERINRLIPQYQGRILIRTFHGLGLYFLKKELKNIGKNSNFTIYDTSLQESLIREILKKYELDSKSYKASSISSIISRSKDSMIYPNQYLEENSHDSYHKTIHQIYSDYEKIKQERNGYDFGDLLAIPVQIFKESDSIRDKYSNIWKYILVDEYQDTNKVQYEWIRLLTLKHKNLCVVGDDDQSIYSWRGADISNILNFEKDFPNTTVIKLEENYRSTKAIINAARHLIAKNLSRKNKNIFTNNEEGSSIQVESYPSEMDESNGIIHNIKRKLREKYSYSDIAIFYRTNAQSRYFEEALRMNSIPYKIFGGFRFYDRKEIKDLISYLNVVVNPEDSTSLLRIINTPGRGIGDSTIEKIVVFSYEKNVSVFQALKENIGLPKSRSLSLFHLHELISQANLKFLNKEKPSDIAYFIIEKSGLREELEKENSEESISRLENINEFVNSLVDYEMKSEEPSLSEFLTGISLVTSEEEGNEITDYVHLMTVHNSKGLEFPIVYLSGLEEGTFPHSMSIDTKDGLEEERRLCYVAITRAREELFLSYNQYTRKFGTVEPRNPSRFLEEISWVEWESPGVARRPDRAPEAKSSATPPQEKSNPIHSNLKPGQKVRHKVYGNGVVLNVTGMGDNKKAEVRFGNLNKKFLLAYTPLDLL